MYKYNYLSIENFSNNLLTCEQIKSHLQQGYLNPDDVNLDDISVPKMYKCIDEKDLYDIISANYVYIYSDVFQKSLAFDTYNTQSYVYIDPKMPEFNDCLNEESSGIQKWRIDIESYLEPKICLVRISSYDTNGTKYYLTANKDGKVSVSLFGGDNSQIWQIYVNNDGDYLIKSYMYCIYLSASNEGYIKNNSGNVYLDNIFGAVGKENIWNFKKCGKRKIDGLPQKISYKPFQSTYDFPYVNDNVGPNFLKETNDKEKDKTEWAGRGEWIDPFKKEWMGTYSYPELIKRTFKCSDRIMNESKIVDLCITINFDNEEPELKMNYLITEPKNIDIDSNKKIYDNNGLIKRYIDYDYKIDSKKYKLKKSSAGVLYNYEDNIFIENVSKGKIRITIRDKDGNIEKQIIAKKIDKCKTDLEIKSKC